MLNTKLVPELFDVKKSADRALPSHDMELQAILNALRIHDPCLPASFMIIYTQQSPRSQQDALQYTEI